MSEFLPYEGIKQIKDAVAPLGEMDAAVLAALPSSSVQAGSNQNNLSLFNYRRYAVGDNIDPVGVGVLVERDSQGLKISGSICGEELGDILLEEAPCHVTDVEAAVREIGRISAALAAHPEVVVAALKDKTRKPQMGGDSKEAVSRVDLTDKDARTQAITEPDVLVLPASTSFITTEASRPESPAAISIPFASLSQQVIDPAAMKAAEALVSIHRGDHGVYPVVSVGGVFVLGYHPIKELEISLRYVVARALEAYAKGRPYP